MLAKKSIETGEDCDAIPESMRTYLANQAMESGKPLGREFLGVRSPGYMNTYGTGGMILNPDSSQPGKIGKLEILFHNCPDTSNKLYSDPPLQLQVT